MKAIVQFLGQSSVAAKLTLHAHILLVLYLVTLTAKWVRRAVPQACFLGGARGRRRVKPLTARKRAPLQSRCVTFYLWAVWAAEGSMGLGACSERCVIPQCVSEFPEPLSSLADGHFCWKEVV